MWAVRNEVGCTILPDRRHVPLRAPCFCQAGVDRAADVFSLARSSILPTFRSPPPARPSAMCSSTFIERRAQRDRICPAAEWLADRLERQTADGLFRRIRLWRPRSAERQPADFLHPMPLQIGKHCLVRQRQFARMLPVVLDASPPGAARHGPTTFRWQARAGRQNCPGSD